MPAYEWPLLNAGETQPPIPLGPLDMVAVREQLPSTFQLGAEEVNVRLEFDVDESGVVTSVNAVTPSLPPTLHVTALALDAEGQQPTPAPTVPPPPLGPALLAAARTLRFRPAQRDGQPIPFPGLVITVACTRVGLERAAYDVFGRRVFVVRSETGWRALYPGAEGKLRLARDLVIPADTPEADLAGYLADLCHEWASPEHPDVRRL